jgi:hypothetical protein
MWWFVILYAYTISCFLLLDIIWKFHVWHITFVFSLQVTASFWPLCWKEVTLQKCNVFLVLACGGLFCCNLGLEATIRQVDHTSSVPRSVRKQARRILPTWSVPKSVSKQAHRILPTSSVPRSASKQTRHIFPFCCLIVTLLELQLITSFVQTCYVSCYQDIKNIWLFFLAIIISYTTRYVLVRCYGKIYET